MEPATSAAKRPRLATHLVTVRTRGSEAKNGHASRFPYSVSAVSAFSLQRAEMVVQGAGKAARIHIGLFLDALADQATYDMLLTPAEFEAWCRDEGGDAVFRTWETTLQDLLAAKTPKAKAKSPPKKKPVPKKRLVDSPLSDDSALTDIDFDITGMSDDEDDVEDDAEEA